MLNMATLLEMSSKNSPGDTAVILDEFKLSYGELNGLAGKVANLLGDLGVQPGDKVAVMLPNTPHFPAVYYGILKAGAVVVPLNVLFTRHEIRYHLEDSDAVALITFESFAQEAAQGYHAVEACRSLLVVRAPGSAGQLPEGAQELMQLLDSRSHTFDTVQTMPDDTAVILYTSGTTGRPKGAELTHFNLFFNALFCSRWLFGLTADDVLLGALPLFHSFGQTCVMNAAFAGGATVTMIPRFEPQKALEIMQRDGVTIFAGVPTMYFYLLNFPAADQFNITTLRSCVSGGSAMPVEIMKTFEEKYGCVILEGYGLSETAPVASFNVRDRPRKPGSIGIPIWGVEMKVVDAEDREVAVDQLGEIAIRGHNVMKGYYKRPEASAEALRNGWFHTGDIARVDEDGYFFIVDRLKDMIVRGGFNVYPREIEEVLYGHPAIAEAAVIGIANERVGEEIHAVVALKPDTHIDAEGLIDYCKERLAAYKYPRTVEFRDSLPKTATGKILKRELRPHSQEQPAG